MASNKARRKELPVLSPNELLLLLAKEKNRKPNYGAILRYFRLQAGWTAERLALLYSEILGLDENRAVTAHWIYMMENQNMVPLDKKRRWILARLLDIPPVLFGLEPLTEMMPRLFQWEEVSVQEYRQALENYCQRWHSGSVFQAINDIRRRIVNLHNTAPYSSEKREMLKLLCSYHILSGDIAHHYMEFESAIHHLDKAVIIAEQEEFYDLWASALRQRGGVYLERGEVAARLTTNGTVQLMLNTYFDQAALNYQAAQKLETKVQPVLRGLISGRAGAAYAYTAQNESEFKNALKILDQSKKYIGKEADDVSTIAAILDEERYHHDRAYVYLAYPRWNSYHAIVARDELEQAEKKTINSIDRNDSAISLLAKSYLVGGQYEMAVSYTEVALNTIQVKGMTTNLARLDMIYHNLKKSSYGKSTDVALLGTKLLKVQKPELFH